MKDKDIVILAHFCDALDGKSNNRFLELASMLSKEHVVEIVTIDFSHMGKLHIMNSVKKYPFQITTLHEGGYCKNVSLKRLLSH